MIRYIVRRVLYAVPILMAINILTFALFFLVNSPDDMARMQLGQKHITKEAIDRWKTAHGYDKPLFYNPNAQGTAQFSDTLFTQKSLRLMMFDFGTSDAGRDISYDISHRMWPSLAIALPVLILGLLVNIMLALLFAFFRSTYLDLVGVVLCIVLMSISSLFFIIGGQFLFGKLLKLVPISGFDFGAESIKFIVLPIAVAVLSGLGSGVRWYRALFLEEMHQDYVRTARAKGLSEACILWRHILRNALLPILTGIVVIIPSLFMGSLILESFFGIPGLGSYMLDAITQQDFAIVRAMVYLGSVLYILGLIVTDITYVIADPRVRLE